MQIIAGFLRDCSTDIYFWIIFIYFNNYVVLSLKLASNNNDVFIYSHIYCEMFM